MSFNPKFTINLSKTFNRAFGGVDRKLRDKIRPTLNNASFRMTFGKMVMDKIIERTLKGVDRNDIEFKAYSKTYRKSDIFKIYAKNPSEVNLKLTGEMLASLTTKGTGAMLSVELIGNDNQAKAHGHVFGLGPKKIRRDFLGLPDNELDEIMQEAVRLSRNDAFDAAVEYYDNTSFAESFGQAGAQEEFNVTVFTQDVLALLAQEIL